MRHHASAIDRRAASAKKTTALTDRRCPLALAMQTHRQASSREHDRRRNWNAFAAVSLLSVALASISLVRGSPTHRHRPFHMIRALLEHNTQSLTPPIRVMSRRGRDSEVPDFLLEELGSQVRVRESVDVPGMAEAADPPSPPTPHTHSLAAGLPWHRRRRQPGGRGAERGCGPHHTLVDPGPCVLSRVLCDRWMDVRVCMALTAFSFIHPSPRPNPHPHRRRPRPSCCPSRGRPWPSCTSW